MSKQTNKRGRGRPKGSTCFVNVRLDDLRDYFGFNASVVVSKKWLNSMGVYVDDAPKKILTPVVEEPKIQFNITD